MKLETGMEAFRTRGRAAKAVLAAVVRELEPSDMALLGEEKGSSAPPLKRIGETHHALARALSSGLQPGEAAIMCGYSLSRVSILQADPAFKELLQFYSQDVDRQYIDFHARLSALRTDAAAELHQRLEETPEAITVNQLLEITKVGADRTGYGPQSSSTNVNVNVDLADRLQAARERVLDRKRVVEQ